MPRSKWFWAALLGSVALPAAAASIKTPDHIVVVIEENHDSDQVVGNSYAPYINGTLIGTGLSYGNAHGTDHPSQPNYLEMFAGSNPGAVPQTGNPTGSPGINTPTPTPLSQRYPTDIPSTSPAAQNALTNGDNYNSGQPFSAPNLGASLLAAGKSFVGYSEDQPSVGFTGAQATGVNGNRSYVEKHNAWAQLQGTGPNELPASTNQPLTPFDALSASRNFASLPTVSFVVPNEYNDMHDTVSKVGLYSVTDPVTGKPTGYDKFGNPVNDNATIQNGDTWLQTHIDAYRHWAMTHNSLLITVWDENDYDFTNENDIPLVVNGDPNLVQPGASSQYVNHFDLLRTLEDEFGLAYAGASATASDFLTSKAGVLIAQPVPEPASLALLGIGLAGLAATRRRAL